jgi:hypothetical protein
MENPSFSLDKVLRLKKSKDVKKYDIVDYHYPRVITKILESYNDYQDFCYYIVDPIILSLPTYDASVVSLHLVEKLQNEGYQCKILYQNKIYIQWAPKERPKDHIPTILKNIENKILHYANNNADNCLLEVPIVLAEFPWYNANETAIIIAEQLYEYGFVVRIKDNWIYISWNLEELGKFKKTKVEFETNDEKRRKAMDKINFINESRYIDFANPKTSKQTETESHHDNEFSVDISEPKKKKKKPSIDYRMFMR